MRHTLTFSKADARSSERIEELKKLMQQYDQIGPMMVETLTNGKIPHTTAKRLLEAMADCGLAERIKIKGGFRYRLKKRTIQQDFAERMKDCETIACAPFSPVMAGAHIVLSGSPCLFMPLNAYVVIGVKRISDKGGKVIVDYPESDYGAAIAGEGSLTFETMQSAANYLFETVNAITDHKLSSRPSYRMNITSTIDISQGCGGSAALSIAGALCFMAEFELINENGPFGENQKEILSRLFEIGFNVEQFIHGKGRVCQDAAPYSSGASVLGSILGSGEAKIYEYRVCNVNELKGEHPKTNQLKYEVHPVCRYIPSDRMFLVLGESKSTAACLQYVSRLRGLTSEKVLMLLFELWKQIVQELNRELKTGMTQYASHLFTMQHGLYTALGLGNENFSRLIENPMLRPDVGGSIIGGGRGGTCLLLASKRLSRERLERVLLVTNPLLVLLPEICMEPSAGAQILKRRRILP